MTDQERDDTDGGSAGGQLSLLDTLSDYTDPSAPPATRAECAGIARPCNRYSCIHNLTPETERAGKPHHGIHPHPVLVEKAQSCELDVSDRGKQTPKQVGEMLGLTPERVRQLEDRAMRKMELAISLEKSIEQLRADLRGKCAIETAYPRTNDPTRVCVVVVVMKIDEQAPQPRASTGPVVIRRKR
jgi:hypothetical protein